MLLGAGGQGEETMRGRVQPPNLCAFCEDRRGGCRFHRFEHLTPALVTREHTQIRDTRGQLRRQTEEGREQQPPQPRISVSLGLRRGKDAVDRRLALHGVVEAVVKSLAAAVEGGERCV